MLWYVHIAQNMKMLDSVEGEVGLVMLHKVTLGESFT